MVKELLDPTDKPGSTTGDTVFCFFVQFFFCLVSFEHYFSFSPFFLLFLLLTLLVHVLGSIYILSVNPEFILEKGFQKLLICILANRYAPINVMPGGGGEGGAWGGDLIVFVGPGVGHLTVPGEGIFESFFARRGDTVEPRSTDTRFTRTVSFVPTKSSYIFSKFNPLYTDNGHFSVSRVTNSHILSTPLYGHWLSAHCLFSLSQLCDNCRHCTLFK